MVVIVKFFGTSEIPKFMQSSIPIAHPTQKPKLYKGFKHKHEHLQLGLEVNWLLVSFWAQFKVLKLMFEALNNSGLK